jgi:putative transferase (TIGR04331 family)
MRISNASNEVVEQTEMKKGSLTFELKSTLVKLVNSAFGRVTRKDEYFFINTYLGRVHNILLQASLGQVPKLWQSSTVPVVQPYSEARQWRLGGGDKGSGFAEFVRTMIPRQIPTAYLEGYKTARSFAGSLPWPQRPKAIFTSNSYGFDDVFKLWAAEKVEKGSPLIIGQHGGNFGMALWGYTEDHQLDIADRFVSWGWTRPGRKNIKPIGHLSGFGKKINPNKSGVALLVEMTLPRYSYHMYSVPVAAEQWASYFEDQCRFIQALPEILREQVLVRLHAQDYGLGQKLRWLDRFPAVRLDENLPSMGALMKKSRLYISSYNSTTYLESMSLNFPTIIFWNPEHWELCDSALPYFEKLKSVGIFHSTPEDAARQMKRVWDDVSGWWESESLQSVLKDFCKQYAHNPPRPLLKLKRLFREVAASKSIFNSGKE